MFTGLSAVARKTVIIAVSVLAVLILAAIVYIGVLLNSNTIYKGVSIEDCDVSGMDFEKAKEVVSFMLKDKYPADNIVFKYGSKSAAYRFEDISFNFLIDESVSKAFETGRTGSMPERLKEIAAAALYGKKLEIEESYDQNKVLKILLKIKSSVDKPATNARISYKNGKIIASEDIPGTFMDIDINRKLVENQLIERNFENIELKVDDIIPEIQYDLVRNIDSVLSNFTTKFNSADENRSYNIKLACSKLSEVILKPGDVFSMNEVLGPRTAENGYLDAPVIYKNELVPGPGGGVCQVTTTLYNAVLKACLKVVERSHHSMTLGYVKPSQDATIAEGSIDFRFKNNMDYPIYINAEVKKNIINISILGKGSKEKRIVKLVSEIIEEYPAEDEITVDNTLGAGETKVVQEARKGLKSALYREIYDSGNNLLEREKISEDVYKPVKGKILVGPGNMLAGPG